MKPKDKNLNDCSREAFRDREIKVRSSGTGPSKILRVKTL